MPDRNDGALQAAIKALEHAVMPAVNPADPLAGEQLRLVCGYLKLLRQRLNQVECRARFELEHHVQMARALAEAFKEAGGEPWARAQAALAEAQPLLDGPVHQPDAVRSTSAALASAISGLVRSVADAAPALQRQVELTVARHSRRWTDVQRAWFAPLGFELHAAELPPLEQALQSARAGRHGG